MKQKGYTLIELVTTIIIIIVIALSLFSLVLNNRGVTEQRAYSGAKQFINNNSIAAKRLTCAGDSDGDGYGTCVIVTTDNERIRLSCPTGWLSTKVFGASSCKEEIQILDLNGSLR